MNIKNFIPSLYQLQSPSKIPLPPEEEKVSLNQLVRYLNYLQTDIQSLHRELTYWDIYKINYVIKDVTTYNSIINNLIPGQTAVVGFENSEVVNGVRKSRGDLIVRLLNGDILEIPSLSSGIYKPQSFSNNKWYFSYTNIMPDDGNTIDVSVTSSDTPGNIYGHLVDITQIYSYTFADKNGVKPIIRFYTENNEIIDLPFSISLNNNVWTVNWTAIHPLATHMQVK